MLLSDILREKGTRVVHVKPGTSVPEAVKTMVENKIGAVLVVDEGHKPTGIFTERDNLRVIANSSGDFNGEIVDNHMTREVVVGEPSDTIEEAMGCMTQERVRHLPVVSEGLLIGLVSIGDVVKAVASKTKQEVRYLKNYIQGNA